MLNGRGWTCVALVVIASWRPGKALLGALLFAFFDALQMRLQQAGGAALLVARKEAYPQALMKAWQKESGDRAHLAWSSASGDFWQFVQLRSCDGGRDLRLVHRHDFTVGVRLATTVQSRCQLCV